MILLEKASSLVQIEITERALEYTSKLINVEPSVSNPVDTNTGGSNRKEKALRASLSRATRKKLRRQL